MTTDRVKVGHAVTFMKYRAGAVSLIHLTKSLFLNKITLLPSNSLNLVELVVTKSISKKI